MKRWWKYLVYELKKYIWALVVLTAVCTLPYVFTVSSMTMSYEYEIKLEFSQGSKLHISDPQIGMVFAMLAVLCYIVPVLVYSFKMSKRGVDAYYSLPLKKEKLYLAKSIVGLVLTVVPYTVAYWLGFLALLAREGNPYQMIWYLPGYFGGLFQGVMLFGVNSFLFTRANKSSDGVIFTLAYAFLGMLIFNYIEGVVDVGIPNVSADQFMTFGGFIGYGTLISNRIMGGTSSWSHLIYPVPALIYTVPAFFGALGWFLLFFCLRFERAENAEQVSESWFGYKVIIPLYTIFLLGFDFLDGVTVCMFVVAAIVMTVVFRRKFRFSWKWWVMIGGAVVLGLVLNSFLSHPVIEIF